MMMPEKIYRMIFWAKIIYNISEMNFKSKTFLPYSMGVDPKNPESLFKL